MARPLEYSPTPVPTDTAQDAVTRLVDTLHAHGVLRLVTNLVAASHGVAEVALKQLGTPQGKNQLENAVVLLTALGDLDPKALAALLTGLDKGVQAAVKTLAERDKPENALALLAKLNDPDVRRGIGALLVLVQTLGQHLAKGTNPQS